MLMLFIAVVGVFVGKLILQLSLFFLLVLFKIVLLVFFFCILDICVQAHLGHKCPNRYWYNMRKY